MFKIIHGDFPTDKTEYRNGGLTISIGFVTAIYAAVALFGTVAIAP